MISKPSYTITSDTLFLIERLGAAITRAEAAGVSCDARLRRINRIRAIRGTLAIAGNTLSEEEISMILDGKPVVAPPGFQGKRPSSTVGRCLAGRFEICCRAYGDNGIVASPDLS